LPLDKASDEKIGEVMDDRRLHGPVMSYLQGGRQYIAVAGGRFDDSQLLVFSLPEASQ